MRCTSHAAAGSCRRCTVPAIIGCCSVGPKRTSDVLSDVLQSGGLIQRQLEMPVTETSDTRELHLQHRLQQRDERRRGPTRESRPSARGRRPRRQEWPRVRARLHLLHSAASRGHQRHIQGLQGQASSLPRARLPSCQAASPLARAAGPALRTPHSALGPRGLA
eukprot:COSAG01_NODE_2776_length_7094_cov_14.701930_6_plen_164_part_00